MVYKISKEQYNLLLNGGKDRNGNMVVKPLKSEEEVIKYINQSYGLKGTVTSIVTY